jgi:putative intracellular protease/amidase
VAVVRLSSALRGADARGVATHNEGAAVTILSEEQVRVRQPEVSTEASHPGRRRRESAGRVRRLTKGLGYLLAALVLPVLGAGWGVVSSATALDSPTVAGPLPAPPPHHPDKRTAVVVAGATGAESIDVLVPYQVLAESGEFNVYTAAPERRPLPLFPGTPTLRGADFLPHFSLAEFDEQITTEPDVIVIPFVPAADSPDNAGLLAWLRERVTPDTTVLTICGGSWVAAEAGLLDGRRATNHQNVLPLVRDTHPTVAWSDGQRWIQDGNVISSAGITAGVDATLRALEQLVGRDAAADVADRIGYPHLRFLDDPSYEVPAADTTVRTVNAAYRWERTRLGVTLYDGVGEIELASIVDLYPRTFTNTIQTIATHDGVVETRHGLHLVARHRLEEPLDVGRVVVPGTPPAQTAAEIDRWAGTRGLRVDAVHEAAAEHFPVDAVLRDLAQRSSRADAALVARGIEYPSVGELAGPGWPYGLLVRPVLLSVLGLAAAFGAARWRGARRSQE